MECGTKIRHATRDEALEHVKRLVWNNHVRSRADRSAGLGVYPCEHCGAWHVGHEKTAPLVWHYTMVAYLDDILKAGCLKPAKARRLFRGRDLRRVRADVRAELEDLREPEPLLWFSRNPDWEYSVIKVRLGDATDRRRFMRSFNEVYGGGLLRFGAPASVAKLRWSDYLARNTTSMRVRDSMAKIGNPTEWLATDDVVSLDIVRTIQVYYRGAWTPVSEVSDQEFDRYLEERPAVYQAAEKTLAAKVAAAVDRDAIVRLGLTEAEAILCDDYEATSHG